MQRGPRDTRHLRAWNGPPTAPELGATGGPGWGPSNVSVAGPSQSGNLVRKPLDLVLQSRGLQHGTDHGHVEIERGVSFGDDFVVLLAYPVPIAGKVARRGERVALHPR